MEGWEAAAQPFFCQAIEAEETTGAVNQDDTVMGADSG